MSLPWSQVCLVALLVRMRDYGEWRNGANINLTCAGVHNNRRQTKSSLARRLSSRQNCDWLALVRCVIGWRSCICTKHLDSNALGVPYDTMPSSRNAYLHCLQGKEVPPRLFTRSNGSFKAKDAANHRPHVRETTTNQQASKGISLLKHKLQQTRD